MLSVGFTTTGASPTHTIHIVPSARCGCSFAPICSAMPNPIFVLQSLRLSSGNEQNLCNLAHCFFIFRLSPPSRKRQGGVNRVPQALQACILAITRGKSGEVREVRGTGDEGRERNWHPHAYPVAPRRDKSERTRIHSVSKIRCG